jgi:hypothetical protein
VNNEQEVGEMQVAIRTDLEQLSENEVAGSLLKELKDADNNQGRERKWGSW